MTARDLFGVAVRVFGIWFLYGAIGNAINLLTSGQTSPPTFHEPELARYKILLGFHAFAGCMMLFGADRIVGWIYGIKRSDK